jgi:hypothetical protein
MYLKRHLIKKFKKRGVIKPVWVVENFLVCKQSEESDVNFIYRGKPPKVKSPYNLK